MDRQGLGKKPCVLLVTAAFESYVAFEYVLSKGGLDIVTVTNRRDAMRELNAHGGREYVAVVIDNHLLNGNGLDLLAELKVKPDQKIPAIFMARHLTDEIRNQASSMGAARIIDREHFGELARLVREVMGKKKAMFVK